MSIIYQTTITEIGKMAKDALDEQMIITFKQDVPPDLADYCFIHCHGILHSEMHVGDILELDGVDYPITAVGSVANQNLKELGHISWRFDNAKQAEYPGTVHLKGDVPQNLDINSQLKIKHFSEE